MKPPDIRFGKGFQEWFDSPIVMSSHLCRTVGDKYLCLKKWMSVFLFLAPFPSLSVPNIVFRGWNHTQSEIQSHGRDLSILPKVYSSSLARNIMTILRISVLAGTIEHETPTWISPRRRISELCG